MTLTETEQSAFMSALDNPTLPFDCWTIIIEHVHFDDLVVLKSVSMSLNHLGTAECRRRVTSTIDLWIPQDWQYFFWRELLTVEGAICGSAVLKILLPRWLSISSTTILDIVVPHDAFPAIEMVLYAAGYESAKRGTRRSSVNARVVRRWFLYNELVSNFPNYTCKSIHRVTD